MDKKNKIYSYYNNISYKLKQFISRIMDDDTSNLNTDNNLIPTNLIFRDIPEFIPPITGGRVIKVYDGDTITIASRINGMINSDIYRFSIRLIEIDTPEMSSHDIIEKDMAKQIRDILSNKIMDKMVNIKIFGTDKYGRILGEITYINEEGILININQWLINNQYALRYDGTKKAIFDYRNYNPELYTDINKSLLKSEEIKVYDDSDDFIEIEK